MILAIDAEIITKQNIGKPPYQKHLDVIGNSIKVEAYNGKRYTYFDSQFFNAESYVDDIAKVLKKNGYVVRKRKDKSLRIAWIFPF